MACFVQIAQASQTQKNVTVLSEYEIIGKQEHKQSKNSFPVTAQFSAKYRCSKQTSTLYTKKKTINQTKNPNTKQPTNQKKKPQTPPKPRRFLGLIAAVYLP